MNTDAPWPDLDEAAWRVFKVACKLVARTRATISTGSPYELRDVDGTPVTRRHGRELAISLAVPEVVRRPSRARSTATRRGRLAR